jgi:hypothetical protein
MDEAFSTAVGGRDAYQLHFAHDGQLPGKFSYAFKAVSSNPGDVLYLYYYYGDSGLCEGIQSSSVNENGYVTFAVYHCSSYFVSAAPVEGAEGVDFAAGAASMLALQEALDKQAELQAQIEELQAQLEDARNTSEELQSEIDSFRVEIPPEANPLTASVYSPAANLFGVPYGALIAAISGAALIAMFLTMLICRVGVFKKKKTDRSDI